MEIYEDRIQEEETINGDEAPQKSSSNSEKQAAEPVTEASQLEQHSQQQQVRSMCTQTSMVGSTPKETESSKDTSNPGSVPHSLGSRQPQRPSKPGKQKQLADSASGGLIWKPKVKQHTNA